MASPSSFVLFALVLFALIVLAKSIKVVPQKSVKLIERLGRFHKRADAGLNVIVPFLDSVRATTDLREQITQIEPQAVITRDNVTMKVDAVIYFVIADPVRATYEVQNLGWGIEQLALSALRNVIGALDLDIDFAAREELRTEISAKFTPERLSGDLAAAGLELVELYTDPDDLFAVSLSRRA